MVSIVIPNYNHAAFIEKRIETVLRQTYQDFEIIILDDFSIDNSRDIINQYSKHPKVSHIIYNDHNSGSTFKQWNKGIALAKGEYIWIAESDDMADPSFLSTVLVGMLKNEKVGISYCQSYKINSENEVTGSWREWTDNLDKIAFLSDFQMSGIDYINKYLIYKNTIPNASGVIFRRSIYEAVGGADEDIKNCSDWLLWLKMLLRSDVSYVSQTLNYFRYHQGSVIANAVRNHKNKYFEWYDRTMRIRLQNYLSEANNTPKLADVMKLNHKYIIEDDGLEGVYYIKNNKLVKGWSKVLKASFSVYTFSYIRLALKETMNVNGSSI